MKKVLLLPLFAALAVSGCASTGESGDSSGTATGAIVGGIIGGILAHNTGSSSRTKTAVGMAAGAAVGGAIGHSMDEKERKIRAIAGERDAKAMEVERLREDLLRVSVSSEASFDFDRAEIRPEFKPTLDKVSRVLRDDPGVRITIIGFTDSIGSEAYNLGLSQRRADATAAYLIGQGVPASQIATEGLGEAEPRASNATEAGRAQNRRVEIYLQQT
ncbi:MAG: OmpA family protein [Gammaproteobacteria bacterium]|nr:OmpA family protein [Gammaproteobacteria bacterium]MCW8927809.1 OmpA family protein [Gammaproteobacteria bacterium]MCW8958262.1 OmpA family protein [Gammaproteobacteria bacterium]MCW8972931.1 OmpA family protein [Gammaproteobacteria bacterium]MCW8993858.1 OmpA family protein [Gammaproteobacteria bacterium]